MRTLVFKILLVGLLLGACAPGPVQANVASQAAQSRPTLAADAVTPTALPLTAAAPTSTAVPPAATPLAIPTTAPTTAPTSTPTATPTSPPAPTAVPPPAATATPIPPTSTPVPATSTPVPTPTSAASQLDVGCAISNSQVLVNETLTFSALQTPANLAVAYAFDHGDGTIDETAESYAYYAEPGSYDVRLRWHFQDQQGTILCGTVQVQSDTPVFNESDYLGHTPEWAGAIAYNQGFEVRIVRIDDEDFPGTADYRTDRVNFEIDDNEVTKATVG